MTPSPIPLRTDRRIDSLAADQHGVVTRRQLMEAGVTSVSIERRLRAGLLVRMHWGVYRVGPVIAPLAAQMAACLACGDGAVLSHRSAAALWQVPTPKAHDSLVDVSLRRGNRQRRGIRIHRPLDLDDGSVTTHGGVPVTTPARTLIDLATCLRPRELEQALAEVLALDLADARRIRAAVAQRAGFPGTNLLLGLLDGGSAALTRSRAEEHFLELVRKAQLEPPAVNRRVAGYEVDFLWKSRRLAVEIDGFAFHSSRTAFERDRRRDAVLAARGLHVVRVTWRQLVDEPEAVLTRLAQALVRAG